jgi:alpha-ketoglutarate-dependent taurine dioxygenase
VTLGAYEHQEVPFEKLVEELRPERSLSHNPLVQVLFVMQNTLRHRQELGGLTWTPFEISNGTSKFDLALFADESEEGIEIAWVYRSDLFDERTVNQMAARFETLLRNIVAQPDARINALEIVAEAEKRERTMEKRERQELQIKKLRTAKRKAVDLSQASGIKMDYLKSGDSSLPLLVQPEIGDIDLVEWAKINYEFVQTQLLRHGGILFRGFDINSTTRFEQFAGSLCTELFGEYGDLPREGIGGKVYGSTPYPSDEAILFHNESSHMHRWPMKIWFYCITAAEQGGETPIVDCRKMYEALAPKVRERFMEKKLMYVRNYTDGLDVSWQDFFQTNDKSAVEAYCRSASLECDWKNGNGLRIRQVCPAIVKHPQTGEMVFFNQLQLHHIYCLAPAVRESLLSMFAEEDLPRNVYYGDGSPIEDSLIEEISELYQATAVSFPWVEGDVLMLNNMLVAHARNPYVGQRKIAVAMGDMISKEEV